MIKLTSLLNEGNTKIPKTGDKIYIKSIKQFKVIESVAYQENPAYWSKKGNEYMPRPGWENGIIIFYYHTNSGGPIQSTFIADYTKLIEVKPGHFKMP